MFLSTSMNSFSISKIILLDIKENLKVIHEGNKRFEKLILEQIKKLNEIEEKYGELK
jgi:hypothetical protein